MKIPSVYPCPTKSRHWKFDCLISVRGIRRHLQSGYLYASPKEAREALESKKVAVLAEREGKRNELFSTLTFRYCEMIREEMKPTSYWGTYLTIGRNLNKPFKGLSIAEVFADDRLHEFRESLSHSGKSERYKNRIMRYLLAIAVFGNDRNIIADFELKKARVYLRSFHGGAEIENPRRAMTIKDYQRFIGAFSKNDKRKILFEFLFATGCRIGEAAAVQICDYNRKENSVLINKTLAYKTEKGSPLTQSPKTKASCRSVNLSRKMGAVLRRYISQLSPAKRTSFLFFGGETPLSLSNVRRAMNATLAKAGLPHFTIHEIRHSVTTWAINALESPSGIHAVSLRLGRSCDSVTLDTYYHGDAKAEKRFLRKMPI